MIIQVLHCPYCHQAHFVSPESLSPFRSRLDAELMDELLAIQSAAAMEANLVSPAHVLIDKVDPTPDIYGPARAVKGLPREKTRLGNRCSHISDLCSEGILDLRALMKSALPLLITTSASKGRVAGQVLGKPV